MRCFIAAAVIIVGFSCLVNAAPTKTLNQLIEEARKSGEAEALRAEDATRLGLPEGLPGKALEVDAKDAEDGMTHDFTVFFKGDVPEVALFTTIKATSRSDELLDLFCDRKGTLNRCYRTVGQRDEKGVRIPGTAKALEVSAKKKEANAALRHELAFWLKGKYRKASK